MVRRILVTAGMAWALAASLAAQEASVLRGRVLDPQGAVVPGAAVTVTGPALQGKKSAVSDDEGGYAILGLPPGTYKLEAQMAGFRNYLVEGIFLRAAQTLDVEVRLQVGGSSTSVEVSADATNTPIIDTANPELKFNVTGEFMNQLPLSNRQQWEQIWFMIPGVATGTSDANFDPEIHGGSARSNVYKLDGFDIGNAFTNQGWTTQFSTEAIADISVKTAGLDASTPLGRGGYVNVVTKSGGNQFHGSASVYLQPQKFNWTNVPGGRPADLVMYQPDLSVGGPIFKDRTWFFGSYRRMFSNEGVGRSATAVQNFVDNGFKVPSFDRLTRSNRGLVKITHKLGESNTMAFRYLDDSGMIYNSDARDQSLQEASIDYGEGGRSYQALWNATITPTLLLEAQYGYRTIDTSTIAKGGDNPAVTRYANTIISAGNLAGQTILLYYGNRSGLAWASKGQRNHHEFTADATWLKHNLLGRHSFQIGVQWKPRTKAFWDNVYASSGLVSVDEVRRTNPNGTVSVAQFHKLYYNPTRIKGFTGSTSVLGTYIQDRWQVKPRLTFNVGVRFDVQRSRDTFDVERFDTLAVGPRLGVAYAVSKQSRDVIRVSWGRINDLIYTQGAPSAGSLTIGRRDEWDNNLDGVFETVRETPPVLTPQYAVTSLIDPKIQTPSHDEFHAGYTRQLPGNVSLDLAWVARSTRNELGNFNTNIIYESGLFKGYKDPAYNAINLYTNLTNFWNSYTSFEVSLIRNIGARWNAIANYSYQRKKLVGAFAYDDVTGYLNPADWFQNDELARTHIVHLNGTYKLPWGFTLATLYSLQSGAASGPITLTLPAIDPKYGPASITLSNGRVVNNPLATTTRLAGPRSEGQFRLPLLPHWNTRFGKRFNITDRQSVEVNVDFFNIVNHASALFFMSGASNQSSPNYGKPNLSSVQAPRAAQISIRYRF